MLTPEQRTHYDTFGFLVIPKLFSQEEIQTIKKESEEICEEVFGCKPSNAKERLSVQPFFERRPFLAQLPDDDRIYGIGEDLLGPDFILDGTEGNFHVGDTRWHGAGGSPLTIRSTKITFYVEPLTKETGCLRLMPGSHNPEVGRNLKALNAILDAREDETENPFGVPGTDLPCVAMELGIGDVVVFMENTNHAAFGGHPGRQQHAINFFENPKTQEQIKWVRDFYEGATWSFRPSKSYINSDRPRIRRMVSKLVELGFEPLDY